MLSWMKDKSVTQYFQYEFEQMDDASVKNFIKESQMDEVNKHFAIVDHNDQYIGTVSLKNINQKEKQAEYAIVMCRENHGDGKAQEATLAILNYAFYELQLKRIYLNVMSDNKKAINFYRKVGFQFLDEVEEGVRINNNFYHLQWYRMLKPLAYQ